MKKLIVSVLILTIVMFSFSACSTFDVFGGNKDVKYKVDDDHAIVSELPNTTGVEEIVIADEYEGVPVTEIADFAGCNLEYVTKITIGKNVETIGEWAFTNNQNLAEYDVAEGNQNFTAVDGVLFSSDMKTILYYPNAGATEYSIPDEVEVIRSKAFYKCGKLEKLTLSASLKEIGEKAFFRCGELQNVTLPEGIEVIAKDAFGYCTALSEIVIPESIKSIGEYAFFNCTSLLSVTVNAKESDIELGKDWQPTNNGLKIDELKLTFKD